MGNEEVKEKMEEMRIKLKINIEKNNLKLKDISKGITNLELKIKQKENEIIESQYRLNQAQLKDKARILIELKKDQKRKEKEIDNLIILNNIMKDNLLVLDGKIEEFKAKEVLEKVNEVLNEISKVNLENIYNYNVNSLLTISKRDENNFKDLKAKNDKYLNNDYDKVENEDEILNRLLVRGYTPNKA